MPGYVNLNPIRNIYLTSGNLGSYNTINLAGNHSKIKKIPVRANQNEIIFNDAVLGLDYIDVSRQTISRIELQLRDHDNNIINLHGNHWSCSLVFTNFKED